MNKYNAERIKAVADKIIKLMETNKENWFKPFSNYTRISSTQFISNQPFNISSGKNYSGFNVLNLTLEQLPYNTSAWVTFKQAKELGGSVLKGETGTPICFYSQINKKNEAKITLAIPETAVSPGQACVFYCKDEIGVRLLGGGWIHSTN